MKKINLFSRNTNSPSYRRTPVSGVFSHGGGFPFPWERGPAEQPGGMGITPSPLSPTKFLKFCGTRFGATPSWKEGDRSVSGRGGLWFAALVALFIATPSFAEPTELDKKTVASKAYVDTKQDIIETGLVTFHEPEEGIDYDVPALVSYGTGTNNADGVLGNKIGVLGMNENIGGLNSYDYLEMMDDEESGYLDNFVPTVRTVSHMFGDVWVNKQNKLPAAWTGTTGISNLGSTGGQTIDLGSPAGRVNQRYITAGGAQPLTQKSGADNVILYINGTKTLAQYQTSNFGGTGDGATINQNYIKGALVSLELLKDVYSALHTEIQNATPTGTPGNVAMYDASTGALGDGVATYDGSTTYNASTDADKIAVMSGVQRKKECGGYEPAPAGQPAHDGTHPGDEDYCWLWIFPD